MSKMGLHDPFGHLKHKLWPKERSGVKFAIWFLTTKSQELPWFPCMQVACHIPLESSRWGLQLYFRPHLNRSLQKNLWASKVTKISISRFLGLQLRSPGTKWHLGVGPMAKHKEYYKGEGGGFPQVWAVVSLESLCLPVDKKCSNYALTNLLFSLCRFMWVIDCLSLFLVLISEL
jgi:hypothetical protein